MISDTLRSPETLFHLDGKVSVVTGASGAFGRAVAIALGAAGGRLLLAGRSATALADVAGEVKQVGGEVQTITRRPTSIEDARAIIGTAQSAFGAVDFLIVASGFNKPAAVLDQQPEDWQTIMDANVRGPWLMAKAFGEATVARQRRGKVLLVSSTRGRHGSASGFTAYCASKGAIDAMTRALALEWGGRGINVNAIGPTIFRSALTAWLYEDTERGRTTREQNLARIPLGRLGEPEDLVGAALFLLSSASDFCTGQVLYVDGGYTAA